MRKLLVLVCGRCSWKGYERMKHGMELWKHGMELCVASYRSEAYGLSV